MNNKVLEYSEVVEMIEKMVLENEIKVDDYDNEVCYEVIKNGDVVDEICFIPADYMDYREFEEIIEEF